MAGPHAGVLDWGEREWGVSVTRQAWGEQRGMTQSCLATTTAPTAVEKERASHVSDLLVD